MNLKKIFIVVTLLLIVSLIFTSGFAQMKMQHKNKDNHHEMKKGEAGTITGHIIGSSCYVTMDMIGEKHKKCAEICAKNGVNLGILEKDTGIIYLSLPRGHGNPNEQLMEFIEEDVKVSGILWKKDGLNAIQIQKVEKVK